MLSKNPTLLLVLGFLTGCGAAIVAPLIVPPAHAQVTQRWETYCEVGRGGTFRGTASNLIEVGNRAGAQGWEPFSVATDAAIICFKRPAPQ